MLWLLSSRGFIGVRKFNYGETNLLSAPTLSALKLKAGLT